MKRDKESSWVNYFVYRIYRNKINQFTFNQFIQCAPVLNMLPKDIVCIIILYFDLPVSRLVHLSQDSNLQFENIIFGNWFEYRFRTKNKYNNIVLRSSGHVEVSLVNQQFIYLAHSRILNMDNYLKDKNTTFGTLSDFPNAFYPIERLKMNLQNLKLGEMPRRNCWFPEYHMIRIDKNLEISFSKLKNLFHKLKKQDPKCPYKHNIFKIVQILKSLLNYKDMVFISKNASNWADLHICFLFDTDLTRVIQELNWTEFLLRYFLKQK